MRIHKEKDLVMILIIIITAILMVTVVFHWLRFGFLVGPYRFSHWLSWIGTLYIIIGVPVVAVIKRRFSKNYPSIFRAHMFGNLLAFLLISLHFASQISRPETSYPSLGTGLVMYILLVLLVSTGIMLRFQLLPKINPVNLRTLHVGFAVTLYLIIFVHILHGIGMI